MEKLKKAILITTAAAAGVACAATALGGLYVFDSSMSRKKTPPKNKKLATESPTDFDFTDYIAEGEKGRELLKSMYCETVKTTAPDGARLSALLVPHKEAKKKFIVCIHGYRSSGMTDFAMHVGHLSDAGFGLLIPDNRAHGESDGRYIGFGWQDRLDCLLWCDYLIRRYGKDISIVLYGVSMGAATVMAAAGEKTAPQIKCVIEDCGFSSGWEELSMQLKKIFGIGPFPLMYSADIWSRILTGNGIRENSAFRQLTKSRLPILFIHGENDRYVPTEMCRKLYESYKGPKMLYIAKNAGHAQSYVNNKEEYISKINEFLDVAMSESELTSKNEHDDDAHRVNAG